MSRCTFWLFLAAVLLGVGVRASTSSAETTAELLEKALYAEQTRGDLEEATRYYRQIIEQEQAQRPLVAQALHRLGLCERKRGNLAAAEAAFRRLTEQYADQRALAAQAETELARLAGRPDTQRANEILTAVEQAEQASASLWTAVEQQDREAAEAAMVRFRDRMNRLAELVPQAAEPVRELLQVAGRLEAALWAGDPWEAVAVGQAAQSTGERLEQIMEQAVAQAQQAAPTSQPTTAGGGVDRVADSPMEAVSILLAAVRRKDFDTLHALMQPKYLQGHPQALAALTEADPQRSLDLSRAGLMQLGIQADRAAAVVGPVKSPAGSEGSLGLALARQPDGRWLIEDMDYLPTEQAAQAFVQGLVASGRQRPGSDAQTAEQLTAGGWAAFEQRQFAAAEASFRASLQKAPGSANAWNGLGWALFNQARADEAQQAFQRALEIDPKTSGALNGLGWIAKARGQAEQAIAYWQQAVAASPAATAALSGLASTSMEQEQYAQAAEYYRQWLRVDASSAEARHGLQTALVLANREKYAALDLGSPEATVRGFMRAAIAGNAERTLLHMVPHAIDYANVREGFLPELMQVLKATNQIAVVVRSREGDHAEVVWRLTFQQPVIAGDKAYQPGDSAELSATLRRIGGFWLIDQF